MKIAFALLVASTSLGFASIDLAGTAQAACREDLVASAQDLEKSRSAVESAAQGTPAQCAALRQHVATLTKIRAVFARCDTGANKSKNAAQVGESITAFTKQMRTSCKS
jgi:prophage DNA circulation protein